MGRFIPLVLCLLPLCRATALVNSEKASLSSCHCSHSHWFYQSDVTASWGNRLMAVSHIGKIGAAMLHRSVALLQSTMLSSSLSSLLSKIYHNSHHRHHYRIYYSLIATGFFSYRRDSAGRRSLRRSRSFEVTNFGNNRKSICDFLFANNTNWHPTSHRLPDNAQCW